MDYLQKNIELLRAKNPELADKIESCAYTEWKPVKITDDVLNLIHNETGAYRYEGDPYLMGKSALQTFNSKNPKTVTFYGVGLGYQIMSYFKEIDRPVTEFILIIERSIEMFKHSLQHFDWSKILTDERVTLFIGEPLETLEATLYEYITAQPKRYIYIKANSVIFDKSISSKSECEYYNEFSLTLKDAIQLYGLDVYGDDEDSYFGFINIIRNLPVAASLQTVDHLKDAFLGKPGVLVGAGPSLKTSIEYLKKIKNDAVIVACDAALRELIKNDIYPHFVCTLERTSDTVSFFKGLPELKNTWLVVAPTVHPDLYDTYKGPKLNMMRVIAQMKWFFPDLDTYSCGHGVTLQIFDLLAHFGCGEIYLFGQDLAYDRNSNATHGVELPTTLVDYYTKERDKVMNSIEKKEEDKVCMVEGNDGQPIPTNGVYNLFRKQLVNHLQDLENVKKFNVIPENFGAKIPGAQRIDPEQVLSQISPEPTDIVSHINAVLTKAPPVDFKGRFNDLKEKISLSIRYLKSYSDISCDVLDALSLIQFQLGVNIFKNEEDYKDLFIQSAKITEDMAYDADDFYMHFFGPQIIRVFYSLSQISHHFLHLEAPLEESLRSRYLCIHEWFKMTHFWATRMRRYLERTLAQWESVQKPSQQNQSANA